MLSDQREWFTGTFLSPQRSQTLWTQKKKKRIRENRKWSEWVLLLGFGKLFARQLLMRWDYCRRSHEIQKSLTQIPHEIPHFQAESHVHLQEIFIWWRKISLSFLLLQPNYKYMGWNKRNTECIKKFYYNPFAKQRGSLLSGYELNDSCII